jgi:hypothetical protein
MCGVVSRAGRRLELAQIEVRHYLVEIGHGHSALELAQAIHGGGATELRVQPAGPAFTTQQRRWGAMSLGRL